MAASNTLAGLDNLGLETRRSFRCFNTDVLIELTDWREASRLPGVEAFLHSFESRFSRFRAESELTRFNERKGDTISVSDGMLDLLSECVRFHWSTGGMFNPLVLTSLEAAGYTVSFEEMGNVWATGRDPRPLPDLSRLRLDGGSRTASLPLGLRLDFGGIGKGFAVDQAASLLEQSEGFMVDAGGDIYASGRSPDGDGWRIDVADPASDATLDTVTIHDQAIATSWTTRRRWKTDSGWAHHLIDPRTGLPADTGVIGATVIAQRAVDADVFAKCALLLGPEEGITLLEDLSTQGLLVLEDGSTKRTKKWPSAWGYGGY